ncbi:MAG TPA: M57 family metalloprotease [Thermoanaerobaculia bacterium]|nr:M57 family metalloprotease [Thermoanaerobaculia bacterium]
MFHVRLSAIVAVLCLSTVAFATTFIVPDDREMVSKSEAIVRGTVVRAWVDDSDLDYIRTMYELRVDKVMKGDVGANGMLTVASPGGASRGQFLHVEGAAHLKPGEDVVLFLTWHRGAWTPTDLTLGKFRFVMSETGRGLMVRDADAISGWNRGGSVHVERARDEESFIDFIEKTARGVKVPQVEYYTSDAIPADTAKIGTNAAPNAAPNAATTYSISFLACDLTRYPARWEDMAGGVAFRKNVNQNATGLVDGGLAIIQNSIAAWTDDCNSAINLNYAGTNTNINTNDGANTIIFNDPNGHIAGSWTGSGVVGSAFTRGGSGHDFENVDFIGITDSDIVFQDGYAGTEPTMQPAMTHEMGHSLGFRHSNQNYLRSCTSSSPISPCNVSCSDVACNPAGMECSSSAIMNSSVNGASTIQIWDRHAAEALYPGGSCATPEPVRHDFNGDGKSDILWRQGNTGENYVYTMNGHQITSAAPINVLPTIWEVAATGDTDGDLKADIVWRQAGDIYLYRMNGNSILSQGFITTVADLAWRIVAMADFNGDNKDDILFRHDITGDNYLYLMNGFAIQTPGFVPQVPDLNWKVAAAADFTGDGAADILWRHEVTGENYLWSMYGHTLLASTFINTIADQGWQVAGAGDFNADGKADIVWKYDTEGYVYLYMMNGPSVIGQGFIADIFDANWRVATVADYNGDGKTDVLLRHAVTGDNYIYLMDGTTITTPGFIQQVPDLNWVIQGR